MRATRPDVVTVWVGRGRNLRASAPDNDPAMTPKNLAAIPAALEVAGDTSMLGMSIDEFTDWRWSTPKVMKAVTTVATILRIDDVRGLCTSEAESLLANRFPPEMARQVLEDLWEWLRAQAVGPGPRLADAQNANAGPQEVVLADEDEGDDDEADLYAFIGRETETPAPMLGKFSPATPQPRESLPAIEAPPQDGEALDRWAERYGVKARLADPLNLKNLQDGYYGVTIEGLPTNARAAVLVTVDSVRAPRIFRTTLVAQVVGMAKSYLHRAAQAVALAHRRQAGRAARSHALSEPVLLRFEEVLRRQQDLLAPEAKQRAAGTFLPGRIYVNAESLALTYREWDIREGRTPNIEGETMFFLHLSGWESGSLRLECKRCRQPLACPHAATVLDECLEALHDPQDPLAASLSSLLRIPGWSRLLERLDTGLGHLAPMEDKGQRLVWEVVSKHNNLSVQPVLQRLGKRGGWGRGQRLRLEALEQNQGLLRQAADRAAFEGLMYSRDNHGYYYPGCDQMPRQVWRALAALAGSSHVFADPSRSVPISVRKVRPALRIEPAEEGFRLKLALGPAEIEPAALLSSAPDGRHAVWLDSEHGRCLVALLEPETIALLQAMASHPVTLPAEGLAELVARLPRLQHALDLHLPEAVRGERVEPPTTTLCRIELSEVTASDTERRTNVPVVRANKRWHWAWGQFEVREFATQALTVARHG